MKRLITFATLALVSGCASPISAWKGRAYGEHSINPNTLITMSGTFRTGRTGYDRDGRAMLCLEPVPEVAGLLGGASKLGYSGATLEDGVTPVLMKGHDSSTRYQEASLAYNMACNELLNGNLDVAEYRMMVSEIIANLTASIYQKPAPAAPAAATKPKPKPRTAARR